VPPLRRERAVLPYRVAPLPTLCACSRQVSPRYTSALNPAAYTQTVARVNHGNQHQSSDVWQMPEIPWYFHAIPTPDLGGPQIRYGPTEH
jgi:hypothetical protein